MKHSGMQLASRVFRIKTLIFLSVFLFTAMVLYRTYEALWSMHDGDSEPFGSSALQVSEDVACKHPDLDLHNEQISKYFENMGTLKCETEPDWLETRKGHVYLNVDAVRRHGNVTCILTYLVRESDFKTVAGKKFVLDHRNGFAKLENDFFTAQCKATDGARWENILMGVARNETLVAEKKKMKPPSTAMNLNVLIFGLDSMSRLHFMRKLPKSYEYLTKVLNATVLKDYNIVGDGTPQALVPIFTGMAEPELPETRHRMPNAHFVNIYPFAWKDFASNGYVTAYGEDMSYVGTFTYRMKGFKEPPTDHYMRTFYVRAESLLKNHPNHCFRGTPRHRVMIGYLRQFFDVYSDIPKFAFIFHSELSHDHYNKVGYVDPDLENFLRGLHQDGILNSTLLIVMSDHGHRFANIRETQQGKQEERLPFFSIRVPPWMEKKYPDAVRNLRINANRLATPFDIYSTLMAVLNPDVPKYGDVTSRSISLFSEIPKERTCKNADIEPHWCACLSWALLSPDDPISKQAGQAVIDYTNGLTKELRDLCVELELDEVTRAEKLIPNKALLKFRKNADQDGFVGEFSDNTAVTEIIYQVQVRAKPSKGLYEVSMKYDVRKNTFHIREQDVSRINMYGNQEHCIHKDYPRLRQYCYCKVQLS